MITKTSVLVCVLKMYPSMVSGDHEGECVCVEAVSSYMVSGDHEDEFFCVC